MWRCLLTRTRADELRAAFDGTFARAVASTADDGEELLAIQIGGAPYALRRTELAGLHVGKIITPLPGGVLGLRGIVGLRGSLLPVYDLAELFGTPAASSRWFAIAAASPVALAFDTFEALVRVHRDAIVEHDGASKFLRHVARGPRVLRPIVDVVTVLETIRAQARLE